VPCANGPRLLGGTLAAIQTHYELWGTAWDRFAAHVRELVARDEVRRVCEIGAGANSALSRQLVRDHQLDDVLLDVSQDELDKAPDD